MNTVSKMALTALATLCLTACDVGVQQELVPAADLVLVGGKIVTVDETNPEVEALAAKGGRIVALGDRSDVEAYIGEGTEVIDLAGALAVPGLIEGHGHFMGLGDSRIQLDLTGAANWQEIVDQVAAAAAEAQPGEWIRGRGWHQDKWDAAPEPQIAGFPVHHSLSAVSPDNPVLLTHASGHGLLANAEAMALAGVDRSSTDPPGGEIARDASGNPTGFFSENAMGPIHAARNTAGSVPESERRRMAALARDECLAKGITSFQDAGSDLETIEFLRQLDSEGELGVRLWIMVHEPNDVLADNLAAIKTVAEGDSHFAVGGIKLWIDGALGSRGAWLLEPYTDSPDSTGLNLIPLDDVRDTAALALENDYQLCIHAIGDRANREVLDIFEEAFTSHPQKSDLRWRVEHAQHIDPEDIPRFAELGVIASMQNVHCTSDGPWVPDRIGDERSEAGAYVWQKLLQSGAVVMNGTDVPVEDVDPIANFHSGVTRRMRNGQRFYPDQAFGRLEALKSTTLDAAFGAKEDHLKGSLEVGKLADVTVLSKDILTVPEEEILDAEVLYTIVGGTVAYRADG